MILFPQVVKRAANGDQNPKWLDALDALRGRKPLTVVEQQDLYAHAVAGTDYPINSVIPAPSGLDTSKPGFYADMSSKCQAFHRVDNNGQVTSYLCPNQTVSSFEHSISRHTGFYLTMPFACRYSTKSA